MWNFDHLEHSLAQVKVDSIIALSAGAVKVEHELATLARHFALNSVWANTSAIVVDEVSEDSLFATELSLNKF